MGLWSHFFGHTPRKPSIAVVDSTERPDVHAGIDVNANSDLITGYTFCATLQLRTPLRVLLHDGEAHASITTPPPVIAKDLWEGCWIPRIKTWAELGIDMPEFDSSERASDVGPIPNDGHYLRFLMAVRHVVEATAPPDARRIALLSELANPEWSAAVATHGGATKIAEQLLPRFVNTLRGVPSGTASLLWDRGLRTPALIGSAQDATLTDIQGIGPARLRSIRAACLAALDQRAEYLDRIIR